MRAASRAVLCAFVACLVALGMLAAPASAAQGDIGYPGPSFAGLNNPPTADKPQSKLWFHDGRWWADMWDTGTADWHIFWLDRTSNSWVDTGVRVDERASTSSDALWDGEKLYIASHVVRAANAASAANQPARLYRFSYSPAARTFTLDAGFPTVINDVSSESLTIDKDSTGTIWATWTQVTGTGASATAAVYVNSTTGTEGAWSNPFLVPTTGGVNPNVAPDDISAVVAFRGRIGVLWSNQRDGNVYWSMHRDTDPRDTWTGRIARQGTDEADDHLNIKSLQSDQVGRVFAVVKTSLDKLASSAPSDPQIRLLVFQPGTGTWSATTFGTIADCHTRPQLVLDETHQRVVVVATGPTAGGQCTATGAGTVYMKTAPMDNPSFAPGVGAPIIRDAASDNLNNVTTTKQSVTASSGLVLLASNSATQRYWHADIDLGAVSAPPTSSFTSSVTSGEAPLAVAFTDTSTGSPTSWAWDFGDGTTSTERNPAHTYATGGTFTVRLVASNAAGNGTAATATVSATAPPASNGSVTPATSTTGVSTAAVSAVTLDRPAALAAGDVLIAHIDANNAPSVTSAPAGWSLVVDPLSVNSRATVFAYYKLISNASAEPASYTWRLSSAQTWNGGITAYRGVDPATPFDTAVATASNVATAATTLTVPEVTTTTAGALVVGGVGMNNAVATVTPPAGWTETWESTSAQVAELAHRARPTAGPTGDATWTFSTAVTSAGWVRALRPAPAGGPPAPTPGSSFTASPVSGTAPMTVTFTDTSTHSPTTWAWNFGDGGTSAEQSPSHTFTAAGTYRVTLTASNAAGAGTTATGTVTVTAPPAGGAGSVTAGASTTTVSGSAVTGVTVNRPAGVVAGDFLVAQFTADGKPTVRSAPAGWSPVIAPLSVGGRATVFAYYKVAGAAESASYTWQLSTAAKWNAGVTAFSGVDPATPFDTAASTVVNSSTNRTSLTVPGVSTTTAGAMLVGGVGMNSSSAAVTPPSGWTEGWESTTAQVSQSAHEARPTAGPTGNATWTFGTAVISAGWLRALRPLR